MTEHRSVLCSMGIHKWYHDSAWFNSVDRCIRCTKPRDKWEDTELQKERELWDQVPTDLTMFQQIRWVKERLDADA